MNLSHYHILHTTSHVYSPSPMTTSVIPEPSELLSFESQRLGVLMYPSHRLLRQDLLGWGDKPRHFIPFRATSWEEEGRVVCQSYVAVAEELFSWELICLHSWGEQFHRPNGVHVVKSIDAERAVGRAICEIDAVIVIQFVFGDALDIPLSEICCRSVQIQSAREGNVQSFHFTKPARIHRYRVLDVDTFHLFRTFFMEAVNIACGC